MTYKLVPKCPNYNKPLELKYFDAGGSFNYGRDPGWKIPGHPIFNPVQNSTKGISAIHIFKLVMHIKYNTIHIEGP